ncbi:MAG TPA: hypothetical protein VK712_00640 [Verrucomicrobiae bacterium]|jgi:hypothetical protein|nr:hypothetical protein [Verrucomicrobiae bacterium]
MSSEEADNLMSTYEKWDAKRAKHEFIHRMERKLSRKERRGRS